MKQSKLFTKTVKELPRDEVSFNAKILIKAGFINKTAAGVHTFLPLGLRAHNKICGIIREEMDAIGGQEILMPALTPKSVWETTGRWKNFDALFKLAGADGKEYALGATHEEVITPLAGNYIFSHKDLPAYIYQIQTKFRNEPRAKSGLLRGREFSMKDLYSFHKDENDLNKYYEVVMKAYFKIFKRCGLGNITYLTYASGGAFSKYSHEFQTLSAAGEDVIYICDKCEVAINEEILADQKNKCPQCGGGKLRKEKAIEVGNIFKLGTRFSRPFKLRYMDEKERARDVIMGCYGIGPSRIMGTIVEVHHDDKGIIWPEEVAPFKVHLLSLGQNEEAEEIYKNLEKSGAEVLYDDRDISAGEKFADADLIGIPYRAVVSRKSLAAGGIELKRRDSRKSEILSAEELLKKLKP